MDKKRQAQCIHERETKGTSYRKLAAKYGSSFSTIGYMIRKHQKKKEEEHVPSISKEVEEMPDDIKALKEALRRERLKNELLNIVVDISSKELGVDLRKKYGTRQSQ